MSDIGKKPGKKEAGGSAADLPAEPEARQSAKLVPLRPRRKCPICGTKATQAAYPFCSVRCADIDLNSWLGGRYRVAGSADDDDAPSAQAASVDGARDNASDND
jgi:endogenous inhibitor of DNA gyrase (YacG/DUF329 family)